MLTWESLQNHFVIPTTLIVEKNENYTTFNEVNNQYYEF